MEKEKIKTIIIYILIITLIIGLVYYFIFPKIVQKYAQAGYSQAVAEIFQVANNCQRVPLTMNNETIELFAIKCLSQGE